MPPTKVSAATELTAPQNLANLYAPFFKADGSPSDARMNMAEVLKSATQVTINGGNVSTGASPLSLSATWTTTGTYAAPLLVNVTESGATANAASKLLDLQVGGASKVRIDKTGKIFSALDNAIALEMGFAGYGFGVNSSGEPVAVVATNPKTVVGSNVTTVGYFGMTGTGAYLPTADVIMARDAADVLALCRSTNAELVRVYETYTDSTTFSRGVFGFRDSASGGTGTGSATTVLRIGTEKGSVGGTARAVSIVTDGVERLGIGATGVVSVVQTLALPAGASSANQYAFWANSNTGQLSFGSSLDAAINRPAAGILGITNGSTGPGVLAIDNVQGASNFERLKAEWASNVARVGTSKGASGTSREFAIITDDTERVKVRADSGSVTITGGTVIASSKPILNTTQTWNDAAVDFVGFKQNITITAANTNSLLFDWQVGGTSYLKLTQFGDLVGSAFTGSDFSVRLQNGSLKLGSASIVSWGSGNAAGSMDSGLARVAAGIVGVTNASTGGGAIEFTEMTAPATPAADKARIFARDNGSGKTQVCVILPDGVVTVLATQT